MKSKNEVSRIYRISFKVTQAIAFFIPILLFSSCKVYLAVGAIVALLPEVIFGGLLIVFVVMMLIGFIVNLFLGGDRD